LRESATGLRDGAGRVRMDARCGAGWRLVIDGRSGLRPSAQTLDDARSIAMKTIVIVPDDDGTRDLFGEAPARELDGIVGRWFDAFCCRAAVVRPDHYVYGVAEDSASLTALTGALIRHLYDFSHSRQ
jgi:3-(3-hydroxy-phenyl)propionate hydroxylase